MATFSGQWDDDDGDWDWDDSSDWDSGEWDKGYDGEWGGFEGYEGYTESEAAVVAGEPPASPPSPGAASEGAPTRETAAERESAPEADPASAVGAAADDVVGPVVAVGGDATAPAVPDGPASPAVEPAVAAAEAGAAPAAGDGGGQSLSPQRPTHTQQPQEVPIAKAEHYGNVESLGVRAHPQGCIRREGTSEAAPEAVRQAVGGGCQSGWGRLLSVTNVEAGTCRPPWRGGGGPPLPMHPCPSPVRELSGPAALA